MSEIKSPENQPNDMNARLKAAVHSVEVPPFLDAKIRRNIQERETTPQRRRWPVLVTAGVAAMFVFGIGIAYQLGTIRVKSGDQQAFLVSVTTKVATLMRVGLGDHIHCSFFRKFPAEPPAVQAMESSLGEEYKDLIPVVRQNVPQEYKLVLGHQCRFNGRTFIHLSLKSDKKLLSLVITAKHPGESFKIEGMLPELVQSGIPIYKSGAERFQIAATETSNHLVYFISDLPGKQNTDLLVTMAPALKTILEKAGA